MKPAWDQLGDEFADSTSVVIGDVDCTVEEELCGKYGVEGYPTIKYFTGATDPTGDSYDGGREYDDLKAFADENLGPSCSNDNIDLCDDDQKAILEKYNAMTAEERQKIIDEATATVEKAENDAQEAVKGLQAQYDTIMKDKDELIKSTQTAELRLLKTIKGDPKDDL
jgi:protein disulfide-isomerase A6